MRTIVILQILFLSFLSFSQLPSYKVRSLKFYREHPYIDQYSLAEYLNTNYEYKKEYTYRISKFPDGYYLQEIERGEFYYEPRYIKVWDLKSQMFLIKETTSKGENIYYGFDTGKDDFFYGYPYWYNDVIDVLESSKNLSCEENYMAGRAYDQLSSQLIFNTRGDNSYERFDGLKKNKQEIESIIKTRQKALAYFEKSSLECPYHDNILGSYEVKNQAMKMAYYYDLKCLAYDSAANIFLEKALFDLVYIEYAQNLLNSCDSNSVLLTFGDMDTYPLVYVQEKLNIRRDITIVNTSLANTSWYIRYLTEIIDEDRRLKIAFSLKDYNSKKANYIFFVNKSGEFLDYEDFSESFKKNEAESNLIVSAEGVKIKNSLIRVDRYLTKSHIFTLDFYQNSGKKLYYSSSGGDYDQFMFTNFKSKGLAYEVVAGDVREYNSNMDTEFNNKYVNNILQLEGLKEKGMIKFNDVKRLSFTYQVYIYSCILDAVNHSVELKEIEKLLDLYLNNFFNAEAKSDRIVYDLIEIIDKDVLFVNKKQMIVDYYLDESAKVESLIAELDDYELEAKLNIYKYISEINENYELQMEKPISFMKMYYNETAF